ncbi:MAG: hypothetical protein ABI589_01880 [Burkholderiales bacterium]
MPKKSALTKLKELDEERPNVPGEHGLALAAGLALIFLTRNRKSVFTRTVSRAAGAAVVARAATGREGLAAKVGRMLS